MPASNTCSRRQRSVNDNNRDRDSDQDDHFGSQRDGYRDQVCYIDDDCHSHKRGSGDAGFDRTYWRGGHANGDAWRTGWGDGRRGAYRAG